MKYKVGDVVTVKKDLNALDEKCQVGVVSGMREYEGKKLTIKDMKNYAYGVEENCYNWEDLLFENEPATTAGMKAYELMKLTVENPQKYSGKKYEVTYGAYDCEGNTITELYIGTDGDFRSKRNGFRVFIGYDTEVKEIPKPVTFMEAVKAYAEGKTIYSEDGILKHTYRFDSCMRDECKSPVSAEEILNRKWFIKE